MAKVEKDRFVQWIREKGAVNVASMLNKHQASVEAWVARRSLPTTLHMMELVRVSNQAFDYRDIIEPYYQANPHIVERYSSFNKHQ